MLSMLAGLQKSENDSESGAQQAASGNISGGRVRRAASISLPHKGAILRHDPAVFD